MGLANWLTLLRIVMVPVFVSLLVYRKPGPALVVFATAAFTDLLDAYIAPGLAARVALWLAALFTVVSGLQYLVQGMRFLNATHDEEREGSREGAFLR